MCVVTSTPDVSVLPVDEPVITVPDAAERMGVVVTRVMAHLGDRDMIAVRKDGVRYLPARYFNEDGQLNRFVPGVIKLLLDGSYTEEEILEFLFTEDDSLPGRPIDAMHGHLAREVMRRAQAMAF
ncbi:Rv2175c family DNA-binding protein [Corynebacterium argentoratense]|uniref:Rv2175c family DNA-binding protein n=1 Tax=Corynebacterium argentoratense TaxID=42817 RepID=UPI0028D0322A|nr:Rv2175c family DNA-binding protein [Corynebacterium argentoratense]